MITLEMFLVICSLSHFSSWSFKLTSLCLLNLQFYWIYNSRNRIFTEACNKIKVSLSTEFFLVGIFNFIVRWNMEKTLIKAPITEAIIHFKCGSGNYRATLLLVANCNFYAPTCQENIFSNCSDLKALLYVKQAKMAYREVGVGFGYLDVLPRQLFCKSAFTNLLPHLYT